MKKKLINLIIWFLFVPGFVENHVLLMKAELQIVMKALDEKWGKSHFLIITTKMHKTSTEHANKMPFLIRFSIRIFLLIANYYCYHVIWRCYRSYDGIWNSSFILTDGWVWRNWMSVLSIYNFEINISNLMKIENVFGDLA